MPISGNDFLTAFDRAIAAKGKPMAQDSVRVQCPHCQRPCNAPTDLLGRKVRCGQCGKSFSLPSIAQGVRQNASYQAASQLQSQASQGSGAPAVTEGPSQRRIGRFEIRSQLGSGSFGAVYRAYDPVLARDIALKLPHSGAAKGSSSASSDARFLREPKAAARLTHPHIVPVFEAGFAGEQFYIASAFVAGKTLEAALDEQRPSLKACVTLVLKLASALNYAHSNGIVHRDIKPANIMLDEKGEPLLMDFGLARLREEEQKFTYDGTILGTPAYMSPEQASGNHAAVGPASDQYALGVIFYEMLCGQRPFSGPPSLVISLHCTQEPPAPRSHNPGIPKDLETICLKALSKEPAARYADCAALQEDLRRWLLGMPVTARPLSAGERALRWCHRNPALAVMTVMLVSILVTATGISSYFAWSASAAAERYRQQRTLAEEKAREAETQTIAANEQRQLAEGKTKEANLNLQQAFLDRAGAIRAARVAGYRKEVKDSLNRAIQLDASTIDLKRVQRELLAPLGDPAGLDPREDAQGFETYRNRAPTYSAISSLPGWLVLVTSPNGKKVARSGMDGLALIDSADKILVQTRGRVGFIHHAVCSPDDKYLATACEEGVEVFNLRDLSPYALHRGDVVTNVAMHPSGKLIATLTRTGRVELWSLTSNRVLAEFNIPNGYGIFLVFSEKGEELIAVPRGPNVAPPANTNFKMPPALVWRITNLPEKQILLGHDGAVTSVVFSPDGKWLGSGSKDQTVRIWNAATGQPEAALSGHKGPVEEVAFSSDSRSLASGDWAGEVKLTSVMGKRELVTFPAPTEPFVQVWRLKFDKEDRTLTAATVRGVVQWPLTKTADSLAAATPTFTKSTTALYELTLNPSGQSHALLDTSQRIHAFNSSSGLTAISDVFCQLKLPCLAFTPDGAGLHLLDLKRHIVTLDWATRKIKQTRSCEFEHGGFAVSPNGGWAAVLMHMNQIAIYDLVKDEIAYELPPEKADIWTLDWSPDGTRIACGLTDSTIAIWNLEAVRGELAQFGISSASTASVTSLASTGK